MLLLSEKKWLARDDKTYRCWTFFVIVQFLKRLSWKQNVVVSSFTEVTKSYFDVKNWTRLEWITFPCLNHEITCKYIIEYYWDNACCYYYSCLLSFICSSSTFGLYKGKNFTKKRRKVGPLFTLSVQKSMFFILSAYRQTKIFEDFGLVWVLA